MSNLYPPAAVGGYEYACHDLAEGMRARGHHVSILTSGLAASRIRDTREARVYRRLKLLPGPYFRKGEAGVSTARAEVDLVNIWAVKRLGAKIRPDLIIFFNGAGLGRPILSAAEKLGPVLYVIGDEWMVGNLRGSAVDPVVSTQPRDFVSLRKSMYRRLLDHLGAPTGPLRAEYLVFCSQSLRSQYVRQGLEVSCSQVINPPVQTDLFSPLGHLERNGSAPRLLYAGRICAPKGVTTLVHALALLRKSRGLEESGLTLAGTFEDGVYEATLRALINTLQLTDAIRIVPQRSRSEMPQLYRNHDVVVFPSEWEEPFGLVLVEAMAMALPVVTTLRGGAREIVGDAPIALPFEAGNPEDLAAKLEWVLTHRREAEEMGRAGREEAVRRFSIDAHISAFERYIPASRKVLSRA